MGSYASAYGWLSAGQNLRDLGELLLRKRELDMAQEERDYERQMAGKYQRAEELAQPGARTLETHLTDPELGGAADVLANPVISADDEGPMEFRAPPPETVGDVTYQDQAPYITPSGVVFDPRASRRQTDRLAEIERQRDLAHLGEELRLRGQVEQEFEPSLEDDLARIRAESRARAEGARIGGTGREYAPVGAPDFKTAYEIVRRHYATEWALYSDGTPDYSRPIAFGGVPESQMVAEAMALARGEVPTAEAPPRQGGTTRILDFIDVGQQSQRPPNYVERRGPPSGRTAAEHFAPVPRDTTRVGTAAPTAVDTAGFGEAQRMARELQAQGLPRAEILKRLKAAGFNVVDPQGG